MSIRVIRILSLLIMAAAAAVSYGTQRTLFVGWKVDSFTAAVAPIAIDLLAIICTLAIHTDGVASKGKRTAILVLVVTGAGSVAANFIAGVTIGSRVVHGAMVVLYLMAEWVAAQVKAAPTAGVDPRRSMAAKKAAATRKTNAAKRTRKPRVGQKATTVAALEAAYQLPSAPVSPASAE